MRRGLLRFAAALAGVALVAAGVARVPDLLARMEVFRLEGLRLEGARFLTAEDLAGMVSPPPDASVWDDPDPWLRTFLEHPLVAEVDVTRRLPDSLVLHVTEVEPVAFVATPTLEPVDADGRPLPIDPSRHRLDLPVVRVSGTGPAGHADGPGAGTAGGPGGVPASLGVRPLAREVHRLEEADPHFVGMLSELSWEAAGDAVALWGEPTVAIRFRPPLAADRLREALAVLSDAMARYPQRRPRAVDLRYAEQVVVRF